MIRKTFLPRTYHRINVVGVGGTGGYFAQGLAKIMAGYKLNTDVCLIDPDFVEEKNCARQNFWHYEIGEPKASALAMRLNQQYGVKFGSFCAGIEEMEYNGYSGVLNVTCVDKIAPRTFMKQRADWLDMGNGETKGQAVFGNCCCDVTLMEEIIHWDGKGHVDSLPNPYIVFDMENLKEEPATPSCADHPFTEQGVFVNEWAAQAGLTILHQLVVRQQLTTPRIYFDNATGRMTPTFITKEIY